jgi:Peptidase_C39 like family
MKTITIKLVRPILAMIGVTLPTIKFHAPNGILRSLRLLAILTPSLVEPVFAQSSTNCDPCWSTVTNWQGAYSLTVTGSGPLPLSGSWQINSTSQGSFTNKNFNGTGTINYKGITAPGACSDGSPVLVCTETVSGALDPIAGVAVLINTTNCTYTVVITDPITTSLTQTPCESSPIQIFLSEFASALLANEITNPYRILPWFQLPRFGQALTVSTNFSGTVIPTQCAGPTTQGQITLTISWNIVPVNNSTNALQVPVLRQNDGNWGSDTYDNSTTDIATLGCALTSLAMALNNAGVSIDPGALNTLMESSTFGVVNDFKGHNVNWGSAVAHATLTQNGTSTLKWHAFKERGTCHLSQALAQGNPVIVAVNFGPKGPGHFVLVTGQQNGQFLINDPGHADRTTLDAYNNTFETRGYVSDPAGDLSTLNIAVDDPADVMVTDPIQRRTGFTPNTGTLEEIPQSAYFIDCLESDNATGAPGNEAAHMVPIVQPPQGPYRIQLTGIESGRYSLTLGSTGTNGSLQPPLLLQGPTQPGLITIYNATLGPSGFVLSSSTPRPVFQQVTRTNNLIWLTWASTPGSSYQLQYTTDLSNTNWANLASPVSATNTTITVSDAIVAGAQRFYRILLAQ